MGILSGLTKLLGQAGHNLEGNTKNAVSAVGKLLGSAQNAVGNAAYGQSDGTNPAPGPNLTDLPHVWGTLATQNAADQQGFAPWFRQLVQGTNPTVGNVSEPGAAADYNPNTNQIQLQSGYLDPYTITHEGLHAAFARKTPAAQAAFAKVATKATPAQKAVLNSTDQLGNPIYGGDRPLTEVHSFLPQYGANSPTSSYYGHYFSNPNFQQEQGTLANIQDAVGGTPLKRFPSDQFFVGDN